LYIIKQILQGNEKALKENIIPVCDIENYKSDRKHIRSRASKVQMTLLKTALTENGLHMMTWKQLISIPKDLGSDGKKLPAVRVIANQWIFIFVQRRKYAFLVLVS